MKIKRETGIDWRGMSRRARSGRVDEEDNTDLRGKDVGTKISMLTFKKFKSFELIFNL